VIDVFDNPENDGLLRPRDTSLVILRVGRLAFKPPKDKAPNIFGGMWASRPTFIELTLRQSFGISLTEKTAG
jgi:hypothetical protein